MSSWRPPGRTVSGPSRARRDELGGADVVRWGVIDLLATTDDPPLQAALVLPDEGEVPIVPVEALVLMKLRASRPQDVADVSRLVAEGADVGGVLAYLREHGPQHVQAFGRIAQDALGRGS